MKCLHLRSYSMFSVLAVATQVLISVNLIAKTADAQNLTPQEKVHQIRIPGDILLGGVFPVHTKISNDEDPCGEIAETRGVHRVEAMLYALDKINEQKDFLNGYKLGALILDSCSDPSYALNQSLEFVRDMIGSSDASGYVCEDNSKPQRGNRDRKNVAAVVGERADAFKNEVQKKGICIAVEERIQNEQESFIKSIDNLVEKLQPEDSVGARVVVLFVGTEYIPQLLHYTTEKMNLTTSSEYNEKKLIWMASESWDRNNAKYTEGVNQLAAEGAIVLMLSSQKVPDFNEYFLNLHPGSDKFERNQWLRELWQVKFKCEIGAPQESSVNRCEDIRQSSEGFNADDKVLYVIDAVYAIAHALQAYTSTACANDTMESNWFSQQNQEPEICQSMQNIDGTEFYNNYLLKVNFEDVVGRNFHFSLQGDGPANYTILTYKPKNMHQKMGQESDPVPVTGSTAKPGSGASPASDYIELGYWSENNLIINEKALWWAGEATPISICSNPCPVGYRKQNIKGEQCCWACIRCEDFEYLVNEAYCVPCDMGWNNETPVVKASCRELSYILLISLMMCYLMTFVLLSRPNVFVCAMKRAGIGFAFSCLYATMFVNTNRIARIFAMASRSKQRPMFISPMSQLVLTGIIVGIQLTGSLIWLLIVPPDSRYDYPRRDQVVLTCNVPDHHFLYSLAYDALLIILCTVYAVKTRKVPENFNETKWIGFAMYTTCVIWLTWVFFFIGTGSDFQIQTTSLCISISMSANVALVCLFSPKVWIIIFEKEKNVRKLDGDMISRSMRGLTYCNSRQLCGSLTNDEPNQYTALLTDTRGRASKKISHPTSKGTTLSNLILKSHSTNNCNKGSDNCKNLSDSNQTYMVDIALGPNEKTEKRTVLLATGYWVSETEDAANLQKKDEKFFKDLKDALQDTAVEIEGGADLPPFETWEDSDLDPRLIANCRKSGYSKPRPIQAALIPHILHGDNVIGVTETGSGKTASFVLPILNQVCVCVIVWREVVFVYLLVVLPGYPARDN
ncbi:hypothetical protein WR25_03680 [Diploscapter pachys]|uniref:RNA helicase n=1 Tax=Diploscapter pachys TaxID=2018661 RepID=A0A2A2LZT6_9BILA|nr:hypothetical protein WR25_03680 [Diploscapter pachys]